MAGGGYGAHGPGVPLGEAAHRLPDTGFPQGQRGAAALRARAAAEILEAVADEMRRAGLGQDGQVTADVDMLSRMRHLVDETIAGLVQPD